MFDNECLAAYPKVVELYHKQCALVKTEDKLSLRAKLYCLVSPQLPYRNPVSSINNLQSHTHLPYNILARNSATPSFLPTETKQNKTAQDKTKQTQCPQTTPPTPQNQQKHNPATTNPQNNTLPLVHNTPQIPLAQAQVMLEKSTKRLCHG